MIFSTKKKVLSAVLSLAMIGTMFASIPFTASADTTTTTAADIGVSYTTQVQTYGWQTAVKDGALAGTVGKAKRLEAIKISLTGADLPTGASITYQTQVQTYGWQTAVSDGTLAGTVGKAKRLEAIKITLSGMPGYSVKYKVQGQTYGWQDWVTTENGTAIADAALSGTVGKAKRLEAIEIEVVKDETPVVPVADLSISSVTAASASTFAVTFNRAPDDTSKIAATVKRSGTAVTVTPTWNTSNTVLTLTYGAKFPASTYTIDVTNDSTEVGTAATVTVSAQKVAKIVLNGSTLSVSTATQYIDTTATTPVSTLSGGNGYISYKVYDQYGIDITDLALAAQGNITWNSSVGTATAVKGLITVKPAAGMYLNTFTTAVITAIDSTSAASLSASLTISTSAGLISDLSLNSLTNVDNKSIVGDDTTNLFYLDYTATDANSITTTNYTLLNSSLMSSKEDATSTETQLYSSYPSVLMAYVEQDSNDSTKAVIRVVPQAGAASIYTDTAVTLTAITTTGKTASITVTVKKPAALDTISLETPSDSIAVDESPVIPFTAYDQDGNALTDYTTIKAGISGTPIGIKMSENVDGTMCLKVDPTYTAQSGTKVLQIYTLTGKSSTITITVDAVAYPTTLKVDSTVVYQYMQEGASQGMAFGVNNHSGLSLVDQYGRTMSLRNDNTYSYDGETTTTHDAAYKVVASSTTTGFVSATQSEAYLGKDIIVTAPTTAGTSTLTLTLEYSTDGSFDTTHTTTVDTKTVTFTTIADTSITDAASYTVGTMYAENWGTTTLLSTALTDSQKAFFAYEAGAYGLTSTGAKVALKTGVVSASTDDTTKFDIIDGYKVVAKDITDATSTGVLTQVVKINDTTIKTVTTPLNATTVAPKASSVGINVTSYAGYTAGTIDGITSTGYSQDGDVVDVTVAAMTALDAQSLVAFNAAGAAVTHDSNLYFSAGDQYNESWTNSLALTVYSGGATYYTDGTSSYDTTDKTLKTVDRSYAVDSATGVVTVVGTPVATDYFTATAVSGNGYNKTIQFKVVA